MKKMKVLTKLVLCIIYIGIIGFLLINCYNMYQEKQKTIHWSEAESIESYSYIDITKMSEKFAYDEEKHVGIHFVIEQEETGLWHTYLVAIKEEEYDIYKEIIDYTYQRTEKKPDKIRVYGYPVIIDEETKQLAIKSIKAFLPSENEIEITNENYEEFLTNSYLDITKPRKEEFNLLLLASMLLLFTISILLVKTILGNNNKKR